MLLLLSTANIGNVNILHENGLVVTTGAHIDVSGRRKSRGSLRVLT